jgi:hypothetical protein
LATTSKAVSRSTFHPPSCKINYILL